MRFNFNQFFKNHISHAHPHAGYTFVVSICGLILALGLCVLRLHMTHVFGTRPMLVMFMLPVTISAMLGSGLQGVLTTLIAAILGNFYFIEPFNSFNVSKSADSIQLIVFIICGFVVSILSEFLHRSFRSLYKVSIHYGP